MSSFISVPVDTELFLYLAKFLKEEGSDRDPVDVVSSAIHYWIDNASWKQEDLMPETLTPEPRQGYVWRSGSKSVLLQDGTDVRIRYKQNEYHAKVENQEILYEGRAFSPAQLANYVTKSSRNAWITLWIRQPGENSWRLADDLRKSAIDIDALFEKHHR